MKWTCAKVERLAKAAQKALGQGKCLQAGMLIDQGYFNLGRSKASQGRRLLRKVDEAFERSCVRKRPR